MKFQVVLAVCILASTLTAAPFEEMAKVVFKYDGREFVCARPCAVKELPAGKTWTAKQYAYKTGDGLLGVNVTWRYYTNFDAAEYTPEFVSLTDRPTKVVSDLATFRFLRKDPLPPLQGPAVTVRALAGDNCQAIAFSPADRDLTHESAATFFSLGRSSDGCVRPESLPGFPVGCMPWGRSYGMGCFRGVMPYFALDFPEGGGLEFAIGWSGSWRCDAARNRDGTVHIWAGPWQTNFRVLPGETLRAPGFVIWRRPKEMTPRQFRTVRHRFMVEEKSPRDAKGEVIKPLLPITFDGGMKTDKMMIDVMNWSCTNGLPFDAFWADGNWNGTAPDQDPMSWKNWRSYHGTWTPNPVVHPEGSFRRVTDAAHAMHSKFILWCEPERVRPDSDFACKLPPSAFLTKADEKCGDAPCWMLNLGSKEGCAAAISTVDRFFSEWGIDCYRQDFNVEYSDVFWRNNDAPDRLGVTEMKYVGGLYRFWDEIKRRHPDALIDNCASGGRRLDIELVSRSHSYCRSDFFIRWRGEAQVLCAQNATLNTLDLVPFQGGEINAAKVGDDYAFFSTVGATAVFTPSNRGYYRKGGIPAKDLAWYKRMFTAVDRMRPFYLGDFYPLTERRGLEQDVWCAWQMHRGVSGFVMAFRRAEVSPSTFVPELGGLEDDTRYLPETWEGGKLGVFTGRELRARPIEVANPRGFALLFYRAVQH